VARFRTLRWRNLAEHADTPLMIDLRNLYDVEETTRQGPEYVSLGRPEPETALRAAAE
jgi:hypothetical protein